MPNLLSAWACGSTVPATRWRTNDLSSGTISTTCRSILKWLENSLITDSSYGEVRKDMKPLSTRYARELRDRWPQGVNSAVDDRRIDPAAQDPHY